MTVEIIVVCGRTGAQTSDPLICSQTRSWLRSCTYMGRAKRICYLSPMRAAKVQASLRIRAVSPEPSLLAHTSSELRGTFRQKAKSLAPLNGWACAVKVCHDGMLEDTNSLGAAHMYKLILSTSYSCTSHSGLLSSLVLERAIKRKHKFMQSHLAEMRKPLNKFQPSNKRGLRKMIALYILLIFYLVPISVLLVLSCAGFVWGFTAQSTL